MNKFSMFSFGQKINKIWIIKLKFCVMFKWSMIYTNVNIKSFTQQMGWLGGKGVEFHPWGPKIKLHKSHVLWSTLESPILGELNAKHWVPCNPCTINPPPTSLVQAFVALYIWSCQHIHRETKGRTCI
jgi:hypothetical protein